MLKVSLAIFIMLCTAACQQEAGLNNNSSATSEGNMFETLSGEVFYLQRMRLPPDAILSVTLEDVSKMDVASTVMASTKQPLHGVPPYAFSLQYQPAMIDRKKAYSLRARVESDGQMIMTSTQALNPFLPEALPIRIKLSMLSSKTSKVAKEKASSDHAGQALTTLSNTHWQLQQLADTPVVMAESQKRAPFMQLNGHDLAVSGFAGCNHMSGSYTIQENSHGLSFGPIAMTRRACMDGMDTESALVSALNTTAYYVIHGHELTLLDAHKNKLATFRAQFFN